MIMKNDLLTLAIHTVPKANILKQILEDSGITVFLENFEHSDNELCSGNRRFVKIKSNDLTKALAIIEENRLFSYNDKQTQAIDDGRRRILVAVDFSDYSLKACQIAFSIAKEVNAKVKILHVYHNIYYPSHLPFADSLKKNPDEGLLNKTRRQMLSLCMDIDGKIAEKKWDSINYSYSLREGLVEEEIESFVHEYKPFLLVLGTKGENNNQSSILGSVTADVIEMINIPVLAIPESTPINSTKDIKHVVFLTSLQSRDFNSFSILLNNFITNKDVKITLMHVKKTSKEDEKWIETQLQNIGEHFKGIYPQLNITYKLIDSTDIVQSVNEYVEKENVTIICLNTRKRNLLERIFLPSVSRKVLIDSDKAILVLRG